MQILRYIHKCTVYIYIYIYVYMQRRGLNMVLYIEVVSLDIITVLVQDRICFVAISIRFPSSSCCLVFFHVPLALRHFALILVRLHWFSSWFLHLPLGFLYYVLFSSSTKRHCRRSHRIRRSQAFPKKGGSNTCCHPKTLNSNRESQSLLGSGCNTVDGPNHLKKGWTCQSYPVYQWKRRQ